MATAPLYGDPKVAPAAVPGEKQQSPGTNLLGGYAQGVSAVGGQLADEAARVKEQFENVAVMGATSELTAHTVDHEVALKSRHGTAAYEYSNAMMGDFDQKASDIGVKLKGSRAKAMFAQEVARLKGGLDSTRKLYIGGELVRDAASTADGFRINHNRLIQQSAISMSLDAKGQLDTRDFDEKLNGLDNATALEYAPQIGTDAGVIAAKQYEDRAAALQDSWLLLQERGQPEVNRQFLAKYGMDMHPGDFATASREAKGASDAADATNVAAEIYGNSMHPNFRPPPKGLKSFPLESGEFEAPIDWSRPATINPATPGQLSTEYSATVRADEIDPSDTSGKWVNIPMVVVESQPAKTVVSIKDGRKTVTTTTARKVGHVVTQEQAIEAVRSHPETILGVYNTLDRADQAADLRHQWWASAEGFDPGDVSMSDRKRGADLLASRIQDPKLRAAVRNENNRQFAEDEGREQLDQNQDYERAYHLMIDQGWHVSDLRTKKPSLINGMDSHWVESLETIDRQRAGLEAAALESAKFYDVMQGLASEDPDVKAEYARTNYFPDFATKKISEQQYQDILKYQKAVREGDAGTLQTLYDSNTVAELYSSQLYSGASPYIPGDEKEGEDLKREKAEFLIDLTEAGQAEMTKSGLSKLPLPKWEELARDLSTSMVFLSGPWSESVMGIGSGFGDPKALVDVAGDIPADVRVEAYRVLRTETQGAIDETMLRTKAALIMDQRAIFDEQLRQNLAFRAKQKKAAEAADAAAAQAGAP